MLVLVVDDSPLAARILAECLRADGHEPLVASDGIEAMRLLERHPVSVVISDWEMPGMGGADLCRAVRLKITGRYIAFLLLTSRDDAETAEEAFDVGADDLMCKPLDVERLSAWLGSLDEVLKQSHSDHNALHAALVAQGGLHKPRRRAVHGNREAA